MKREHQNYFVKRYIEALKVESHFEFIENQTTLEFLKVKDMLVTEQKCVALVVLNFEKEFFLYYPFEQEGLELIALPKDEEPIVFNDLGSAEKLFAYTGQTLALIYQDNVVKFFEHYKEGFNIEVKLEAQPKMIVGKAGRFYILLEDENMITMNKEGEILEDEEDTNLFEELSPQLNSDIKFEKFGIDCFGDLWVLEQESQIIHHFLKTLFYENIHQVEEVLFDSFDDYTLWSNLYIDWNLPSGTKVEVEVKVDEGETQVFTNLSNMLLYDFKGKVLHVKVTLYSNDSHTLSPTINNIRVTFNQKPYIDYLPAYYQKDKEVLSRYLSIFQEIMGEFETKIEKSSEMLNPMLCDEEYLAWLSSLLGVQRDYRWEEKRWRKFLAKLPHLYQGLGTKKVMQEAIALYCDEEPQIDDELENKPWTFCVTLSSEKIENRKDIEVIESIIETFKPAHTTGRLLIDDKERFIVEKSFLAINTKI